MKKITLYILSFVFAFTLLDTVGCGGSSKHKIARDNELRSKLVVRKQSHRKPSKAKQSEFVWPVEGPVMSQFGIRRGRRHDGIDVSAHSGTPIRAASDGEVVFSGTMHGYGNLILVRHDDNYFTAYAHNSANLVDEGKNVSQGDIIAEVGRTGRATGNHLHFEIRRGQEAMDPLAFLPAIEGMYVKQKSPEGKARYATRDRKHGSKLALKDKSKKDASNSKEVLRKGKKGKDTPDLIAKKDTGAAKQVPTGKSKNKNVASAKTASVAKTDSKLKSLNELTAEAKNTASKDSAAVAEAKKAPTAGATKVAKKGPAKADSTNVAKKVTPATTTTKLAKKGAQATDSTKVAKKTQATATKPVAKKTQTAATTKVAKSKTPADAKKVAKAKPAASKTTNPAAKKEIVMKETGAVKGASSQ